MRTCLVAFCILSSFVFCHGQASEQPRLNALSLEIGKTGLIFNLTYDHKIKNSKVGFRLGFGASVPGNLQAITTGGGGYFLIGSSVQFLELDADLHYLYVDEDSDDQKGVPVVYPNYDVSTLYPSLNVGYRKYGKISLFRIGFSPGIIDNEFVPGGYISYGITF